MVSLEVFLQTLDWRSRRENTWKSRAVIRLPCSGLLRALDSWKACHKSGEDFQKNR